MSVTQQIILSKLISDMWIITTQTLTHFAKSEYSKPEGLVLGPSSPLDQ
jgi:hypothetical protein